MSFYCPYTATVLIRLSTRLCTNPLRLSTITMWLCVLTGLSAVLTKLPTVCVVSSQGFVLLLLLFVDHCGLLLSSQGYYKPSMPFTCLNETSCCSHKDFFFLSSWFSTIPLWLSTVLTRHSTASTMLSTFPLWSSTSQSLSLSSFDFLLSSYITVHYIYWADAFFQNNLQ